MCEQDIDKRERQRDSGNGTVHTQVPRGPDASDIKGVTQAMTISHSEMVTFLMC